MKTCQRVLLALASLSVVTPAIAQVCTTALSIGCYVELVCRHEYQQSSPPTCWCEICPYHKIYHPTDGDTPGAALYGPPNESGVSRCYLYKKDVPPSGVCGDTCADGQLWDSWNHTAITSATRYGNC